MADHTHWDNEMIHKGQLLQGHKQAIIMYLKVLSIES